jgi:hypothetical protein
MLDDAAYGFKKWVIRTDLLQNLGVCRLRFPASDDFLSGGALTLRQLQQVVLAHPVGQRVGELP